MKHIRDKLHPTDEFYLKQKCPGAGHEGAWKTGGIVPHIP